MNEFNWNQLEALTYEAIIRLELPGENVREVAIRLLPGDKLSLVKNGRVRHKKLSNCTLGDLETYAEQLGADIADTAAQITVWDLVKDEGIRVGIRVENPRTDDVPDAQGWLSEGIVVWPAEVERIETIEARADETSGQDRPIADEEDGVDESVEQPTDVRAEEPIPPTEEEMDVAPADLAPDAPANAAAPTEEEPADVMDADAGENGDDVSIVVAESEPVHEERENEDTAERTDVDYVIRKKDVAARVAGKVAPLEDPTPAAVDVLVDESAFRYTQKHAKSSMRREVAGVLVGPQPEKQPNGRYVVQVTDAIEAKHTRMQGASVTYTPESWRYVNDKLWEMYPDEACIIVGWYHTHPGFGIFLSNMDLFIHHNFFTQKWHIALVLDPVGEKSGFFTWNRTQTQVMAYHFPWPYWAHSSW